MNLQNCASLFLERKKSFSKKSHLCVVSTFSNIYDNNFRVISPIVDVWKDRQIASSRKFLESTNQIFWVLPNCGWFPYLVASTSSLVADLSGLLKQVLRGSFFVPTISPEKSLWRNLLHMKPMIYSPANITSYSIYTWISTTLSHIQKIALFVWLLWFFGLKETSHLKPS